ncbi:hypothetical protein AVEN_177831-1 [Araneus ventricosus]|uniref:Transcription factor IIIC 90kDa subunit N-terminal domain-containing protein n=1 Tax=Araneus ventricosus TaxID=182803 RepID=A0A4Y2X4U1_ARAVE|nr:hypothetical protein AVEN_177831-1 [Araneus ventricosus]
MDHRLALYEEIEKEWKCICDLTELLKKEIVPDKSNVASETKQNKINRKRKKRESRTRGKGKRHTIVLDDTDEEDEDYEEEPFNFSKSLNYEKLMKETYKYAPMEITWTGMFGGPATAISDKSHEFCFLIVAMKSGHIQFWRVSPSEGRTISLVYECDMALGMITSLSWQQTSSTAGKTPVLN